MANGVTNKDLYDTINSFRMEVRAEYVTKDEFSPVRKAVFGTIALVLTAFILAAVAFFIPTIRNERVVSGSNQAQASTPSAPASAKASAKATADGKTSEQNAIDGVINSLPKVTP